MENLKKLVKYEYNKELKTKIMIIDEEAFKCNNEEISDNNLRDKFGMYKGFQVWDLTKAYLTMDNNTFFSIYGFNFVPPVQLAEVVKNFLMIREKYLIENSLSRIGKISNYMYK